MNKKIYIVIIIILIILSCIAGVFIYCNKSESNINEYTIKELNKESIQKFISLMVDTNYNNIEEISNNYSKDDYSTFIRIIKMLIKSNNYEKLNNIYYFNLEDVNKIANLYFNIDNYNYNGNNNIKLVNKKYKVSSNIDLFKIDYSLYNYTNLSDVRYNEPIVLNYEVDNNNIKVKINIDTEFDIDDHQGIDYIMTETNYYYVNLLYDNNIYKIKSISKIEN